jgi:outer membrane murein-binding lipoprotein Lpp
MIESKLIVAVPGGLLAVGCAADQKRSSNHDTEITELTTKLDSLQKEIESLKADVALRDHSSAYLTPGSDGYSILDTDVGRMTISMKDVQPYADGSKVTLQFGNLTSATVDGVKATVEWGSNEKGFLDYMSSLRFREVAFTQSLRSGAWTSIPIVLEGIPPTQLGFVRVTKIAHTGVSLSR